MARKYDEGKAEEKIAIAKKILKRNVASEDIADFTGFSINEISAFKR